MYSADIQSLILQIFGDRSAATDRYGSCVVRAVGRSRVLGAIIAAPEKLIEAF